MQIMSRCDQSATLAGLSRIPPAEHVEAKARDSCAGVAAYCSFLAHKYDISCGGLFPEFLVVPSVSDGSVVLPEGRDGFCRGEIRCFGAVKNKGEQPCYGPTSEWSCSRNYGARGCPRVRSRRSSAAL